MTQRPSRTTLGGQRSFSRFSCCISPPLLCSQCNTLLWIPLTTVFSGTGRCHLLPAAAPGPAMLSRVTPAISQHGSRDTQLIGPATGSSTAAPHICSGKLPTAVGGAVRPDTGHCAWPPGRAGWRKRVLPQAGDGGIATRHVTAASRAVPKLWQRRNPQAQPESPACHQRPQQPPKSRDVNAEVRQDLPPRAPRAVSGGDDDPVIEHGPVELLRALLSVSTDHQAVPQDGTQVPVQSCVFLAPKQNVKTCIRKGASPLPRARCPQPSPRSGSPEPAAPVYAAVNRVSKKEKYPAFTF